jgi:hypothetical protein
MTGCGGGTGTNLSGNTSVTVLASSTANDQLSAFNIAVSSVTLTSQSGKTVTLFATPQTVEFIHLNGGVEPLTTVSIPQGVYISATASVDNQATPVCVAQDSTTGGLLYNAAIGNMRSGVTVDLPAPITVTGTSMGLSLNLLVSESVSSFDCISDTLGEASIAPTFNLTPVTIAAQPTNSANGKATDLHGTISAVTAGGTGFSVSGAYKFSVDGPTWQVSTNSSTVFQGITGASQLAAGMPVDMDVAIQSDGLLLATRVAVYDTNTSNLSISTGPLQEVAAALPADSALLVENQGPLLQGSLNIFNFGNAVFQTSGQLTNVQNLPFTASFNASNMVPGQNVFTTTHTLSDQGSNYPPATTITLIPQTINGKISAVSSSSSFTTYTVTLAGYDLFPDLAVQPGQTTLLTNPGSVVIYVDSNTQMLNTTPLVVGGVLRFNGLVFNDNGTLRMDCAEIFDGVAE